MNTPFSIVSRLLFKVFFKLSKILFIVTPCNVSKFPPFRSKHHILRERQSNSALSFEFAELELNRTLREVECNLLERKYIFPRIMNLMEKELLLFGEALSYYPLTDFPSSIYGIFCNKKGYYS